MKRYLFFTILVSSVFCVRFVLAAKKQITSPEQVYFAETLGLFGVSEVGVLKDKAIQAGLPRMIALKELEQARQFSVCASRGEEAFRKSKDFLRPWILATWLRCSRKSEADSKEDILRKTFLAARELESSFLSGPWRQSLMSELIKARLEYSVLMAKKQPQSPDGHNDNNFLQLLSLLDRLDKDQRALLWSLIGEQSQLKKQDAAALHFYRLSLSERETKIVRDKWAQLMLKLNLNDPKPADQGPLVDFTPDEEKAFEERISSSFKVGDLGNFLEDAVQFLQRFPGGRKSKWVNEKILETHFSIWEGATSGSDVNKISGFRVQALKTLAKADSLRKLEWVRAFHRRGDDEATLALADGLSNELKASNQGGVLYYLAGRAAQFSGNYKKASQFFEAYLDRFSGGEDYNEVLFRLGLVYLREGLFSSALASFEKLLLAKGIEKYELSARYWLVRTLQWTNNPRSEGERNLILTKFPLSYYGLRLRAELQGDFTLEFPFLAPTANENKKQTFFWTRTQREGLDRAAVLSKAGWIAEAQQEVLDLQLPSPPWNKAHLGKRWAELSAFFLAIRHTNEASDYIPEVRSEGFLRLTYPKIFYPRVVAEAKSGGLDPLLIYSLIRQESAFNLKATSTSNAIGLMQMIPPTAQEIINDLRLENKWGKLSVPEDIYDVELNIKMGTYYLGKMMKMFSGSVPLALAAYNAGPTRLSAFVKKRPDLFYQGNGNLNGFEEIWYDELPWYETSFYVKAILRNLLIYQILEGPVGKPAKVKADPQFWKTKV